MSMGGESTATSVTINSGERAVFGHVSRTDIHTKTGIVWTAARHRAEYQPYVEKS